MSIRTMSIIGSSGLLGRELTRLLENEDGWNVLTPGQGVLERVNIVDRFSVERHLETYQPDVIVNCAAFSQVDSCEKPEAFEQANAVNGYGVGNLAEHCKKFNTMLVHISSDYVFGDNRPEGYDEYYADFSPLNNYGRSKLLGEEKLAQAFGGVANSDFAVQNPRTYIIRTSWLFGSGMNNFAGKILSLAIEGKDLFVVDDEIGSPTYTKDLAKAILFILTQDLSGGVYHVTGNGHCSRYEFAKRVLGHAGFADKVFPMKLKDYARSAQVPAFSVLLNTKLPKARNWEEMVDDFGVNRMTSTGISIPLNVGLGS